MVKGIVKKGSKVPTKGTYKGKLAKPKKYKIKKGQGLAKKKTSKA